MRARVCTDRCRWHDIVIATNVLQVQGRTVPRLRHRIDRAFEWVVAVISGPGVGIQICADRNDAFDTLDSGLQQHGKNTSAAVTNQNDAWV